MQVIQAIRWFHLPLYYYINNALFKKFSATVFYGNYFYALCTVALSVETSMQQQYALNSSLYYVLIFSATIVYYTQAYAGAVSEDTADKRSQWYLHHAKFVSAANYFFLQLVCVAL